jgi:hypothetical protein
MHTLYFIKYSRKNLRFEKVNSMVTTPIKCAPSETLINLQISPSHLAVVVHLIYSALGIARTAKRHA